MKVWVVTELSNLNLDSDCGEVSVFKILTGAREQVSAYVDGLNENFKHNRYASEFSFEEFEVVKV